MVDSPYKHSSLAGLLRWRRHQTPDGTAFRTKDDGHYKNTSWRRVGERMDAIASGLLTIDKALPFGARITLMGEAGLDWIVTDFAALSIGLQTVPIYASLKGADVSYMHEDTEALVAVVDDAAQLAKLRDAAREGSLKVHHIVVIRSDGIEAADDWESLASLEARGRKELAATADERQHRESLATREDVATFTYTSGTTGVPKAVIQTHENMLSMLEAVGELGLFGESTKEYGLFLFLPPAHSFGRLVELAAPYFGAALVLSSIPTLGEDLALARPGFFPSAPRVYEKMRTKIESAVKAAPPMKKALFRWALKVGEETIPFRSAGRPIPLWLRAKAHLARRLVWSKLRARLGLDRAGLLLSGSAPLSPDVHRFFLSLGLDLMEAYGLTETCPGLTTNIPGAFRVGTVGRAFPGITLRIAEDGEILARGANIFQGYLNQSEATEEAFDEEGWFKTGDLGSVDSDGFVQITGRKKELLKTSGGKYIVPTKIEERLRAHRLVQEAVVVGDARNYCVCLIAIDDEERQQRTDDELRADIAAHVGSVNATLARFETMKDFRLTGEMLSVENQTLTASLKIRRKAIAERFAPLIEEMYAK